MPKRAERVVCAGTAVVFATAVALAQAGFGAPAASKGAPSRAPEEIRIVEARKDDDRRKDDL